MTLTRKHVFDIYNRTEYHVNSLCCKHVADTVVLTVRYWWSPWLENLLKFTLVEL